MYLVSSHLVIPTHSSCCLGLSLCVVVDCSVIIIAHRPTVGCCVCRCRRVASCPLTHRFSHLSRRVSRVASLCCVTPSSSPTARHRRVVVVASRRVASRLVSSCLVSSYPLTHLVVAVSRIASSLIVASSSSPIALRLVVVFIVVVASRYVPSRVASRISRVASLCCVTSSSPAARP